MAEMDRDEEIRKIEDEKYFEASDEKFVEMQKRLQLLKEENKRQMDIIMNNLDELIANKMVIDKALENADEIEPIINDDNLSIVDLLAKVTGYINDNEITNNMSLHEMANMTLVHESAEDIVATNDEEMNDVEKRDLENSKEVTPDIKDSENKSEVEEVSKNENTQVKSQVESERKSETNEVSKNVDTQVESQVESEKKSESREVSKTEDAQIKETELCDSTKLLENLNICSTDDNSKEQILSEEAK